MFLLESIRELDQEQRWNPTFQMMHLDTRELIDGKTQNTAKNPKNRHLNRYRDVLPYDDTRVVLETGDHDYINANVVEVPEIKRRYILTQGPTENSCGDFWRMIWENGTMVVIMLCRIVEKQLIKCHPYWPLGEDEVVEFGRFQIKNMGCQNEHHYIVRDLSLTNLLTDESRVVKQFHFITWPDFGVPENASSFVEFLNALRESNAFEPSTPPVIHCSAGIGRSGTLILVDAALKIAEQNKSPNGLDIRQLLLSMRQQRCGLVQTAQQYRFANLAIVAGLHTLFPNVFESQNTNKQDSDNESDDVPPPLPEKSKSISPPMKPPRTPNYTDATHENDVKMYNKLTDFYGDDDDTDEDDDDNEEIEEYINLSDPAFGSDENHDDDDTTKQTSFPNQDINTSKTSLADDSASDSAADDRIVENTTEDNEIGSKAREKELRHRRRQQRKEATQELVRSIKQKMKDSETPKGKSRPWLYIGIAVAATSCIYLVSKWFS